MNKENTPSLKKADILFLSLGGLGFSPIAPGTIGTIASVPILYMLTCFELPLSYFIFGFILLATISCFIAENAQRSFNSHDPQWIVVDETLGLLATWPFLKSNHWTHLLSVFLLFRFFDIIKVWPASYFDRKVEHGLGIIVDDIISGLYAGCIYLLALYFYSLTYA